MAAWQRRRQREYRTMAKKETLGAYLNRNIEEKGSTLKKEKAKGKKYTSIKAAQKAGALYYMKNGKLMAAVFAEDLKVRPVAKPLTAVQKKQLQDAANFKDEPSPKGSQTLKAPVRGVGAGVFAGKGAGKDKPKTAKTNGSGTKTKGDNYGTLARIGTTINKKTWDSMTPDQREARGFPRSSFFAGVKTGQYTSQVKGKDIKITSTNKNKGGPVTKKPKGAYMAGGMAAAKKKKKPAAKKMMGGGMTKKSGYMYGGMAKKKKK